MVQVLLTGTGNVCQEVRLEAIQSKNYKCTNFFSSQIDQITDLSVPKSVFFTSGFPPIREFRGNFEHFFQSGRSGKNGGGGVQPKSGEKIWNQGTFFKNIFNLLMWGKKNFFYVGRFYYFYDVYLWSIGVTVNTTPMASGGHI